MARNVLQSSLQSASFSIVFQIFCRCVTFAINAFIVRTVGRDVLGIMNVRLLLLESTLLFLSKEAINRAALSSTTQHHSKCSWAQLINQMWLTVPICTALSIPCLYIWLNLLSPVENHLWTQYKFGCLAMTISCILELCAEAPLFIAQVFCFVKLKVVLDTLHIFVRSVVFIGIVLKNPDIAIYAFGIAQLASIFAIVVGYYAYFYTYISKKDDDPSRKTSEDEPHKEHTLADKFPLQSVAELLPGVLRNKDKPFNPELQTLTLSFVKQGVLKQILTEGEKYVMSVSPVLTFSEQATYDVVNNLGSLAARFIFRPIEDSSYFYFTQTIARDIDLKKQNKIKVLEAAEVLKTVCKTVSSVGLLVLVFGQFYSGICLLFYGGADFVAGGLPETLLRWHCLSILFLAVNGITEGYMFATNTSKDIDTYNYYMAVFSIMFLVLSYAFTNVFGPVGLILANCLNMLCRISYSTYFIHNKYKDININPLEGIIPGKTFAVALISSTIILTFAKNRLLDYSILYFFAWGCLCGAFTLLAWAFENRTLVKQLIEKYGSKLKKT